MKVLIVLISILTISSAAAISLMIGLGRSPLLESDVISFASNQYEVGDDQTTIIHRLYVMNSERGLLHVVVEGMKSIITVAYWDDYFPPWRP